MAYLFEKVLFLLSDAVSSSMRFLTNPRYHELAMTVSMMYGTLGATTLTYSFWSVMTLYISRRTSLGSKFWMEGTSRSNSEINLSADLRI